MGGWGSSPLSRGIRSDVALRQCDGGIIPALAGNTEPQPQPGTAARIIPALAGNTHRPRRGDQANEDHPRSRGEYISAPPSRRPGIGSSPLSRGIPRQGLRRHEERRIIPALAGNTVAAGNLRALQTDHPRSRGEYGRRGGLRRPHEGSSPLSRGILEAIPPLGSPRGIIPALAGNTFRGRRAVPKPSDHPRSRGEYPTVRR